MSGAQYFTCSFYSHSLFEKLDLKKNSESVPSEIWFTSTHRQRYQHHRWFISVANQRPVSVQHWPMRVRATDLNDLTRYCSWEIVQAPGTGPDFRQWAGERERTRPLGGTFILFACHCPDTYFLFKARDLLFAKILVCVPPVSDWRGYNFTIFLASSCSDVHWANTPDWKIRLQARIIRIYW